MNVRLHAFEPRSRANGPGLRAVIWFQGCTLGCPGCFNPSSHSATGGWLANTAELAARLTADAEILEGVTFTGGEPLEQADAVLDLLRRLAPKRLGLCLLTGYTWTELQDLPAAGATLELLDVVICGRYDATQHLGRGLRGSANQELHCLSSRYTAADFEDVPQCEAVLHGDGTVTWTGVRRLRR